MGSGRLVGVDPGLRRRAIGPASGAVAAVFGGAIRALAARAARDDTILRNWMNEGSKLVVVEKEGP